MKHTDSGLYVPEEKKLVRPQFLSFQPATVTEFGKKWLAERFDMEHIKWVCDKMRASFTPEMALPPIAGGSGGFSNWMQTAVLAHGSGQDNASWANLSPGFLALCTAVPDSSKTGSTITEAAYTGYGRVSLANTAWNAAVSGGAGGTSTITNSGTITFGACTASSSTVIGYAYCTATSAGSVIAWGSCTSIVISTTQTPPTVAAGALQMGLL